MDPLMVSLAEMRQRRNILDLYQGCRKGGGNAYGIYFPTVCERVWSLSAARPSHNDQGWTSCIP